jgi:hypothetical protein
MLNLYVRVIPLSSQVKLSLGILPPLVFSFTHVADGLAMRCDEQSMIWPIVLAIPCMRLLLLGAFGVTVHELVEIHT